MNNKGADQPAHPHSLISTFVIRCLDSIIPPFYNKNFKPLASFCGCAGWVESYLFATPEDRFSRDEAHIYHASIIFKPTHYPLLGRGLQGFSIIVFSLASSTTPPPPVLMLYRSLISDLNNQHSFYFYSFTCQDF